MRCLPFVLALLLTVVSAGSAVAGGLHTPDTGIVGLGRGGANVARAEDLVSGLYYNPAGLWQIDGLSAQGGLHLLRTDVWFDRAGGEGIYNVDDDGVPIEGSLDEPFGRTHKLPHTRPIPEGGVAFGFDRPDLTIALGLYAPMAPVQSFPEYGPGRYRLVEQRLTQGNISLSVGWRIVDWIAVGASFQLVLMRLEQTFKSSSDFLAVTSGELTEDPQWDVTTGFRADDLQPHFNVGVLLMPLPWLRVAASFEPPYRFEGEGTASLDGTLGEPFLGALPESLGGGTPIVARGRDDEIVVRTGLPGRLRVGVSVEPVRDVLEVELDFDVEIWRSSGDVVASDLEMSLTHSGDDVDEPVPMDEYLDSRGLCGLVDCATTATYAGETGDGTITMPTDFEDTWSLRFGGEVRPLPALGLRFGAAWEAPAARLQTQSLAMLDGHKVLAAGGLSLRPGAGQEHGAVMELHVSYGHVFYVPRTVDGAISRGRTKALEGVPTNRIDAGTYGGWANMFGVNLAAHFGAMHRRRAASNASAEGRD